MLSQVCEFYVFVLNVWPLTIVLTDTLTSPSQSTALWNTEENNVILRLLKDIKINCILYLLPNSIIYLPILSTSGYWKMQEHCMCGCGLVNLIFLVDDTR